MGRRRTGRSGPFHLDTVHPPGTIDRELRVRREGDRVYGPGIYDMKGGAYLGFYALRHLIRSGRETPLPITFMFVPEEEVGSPTSREAIERGSANQYALVLEPAREGGKIVTGRRGAARYTVQVEGVPAHSGLRHQDGRNAIKEMAQQILRIEGLTDYDRELTLNVGLIKEEQVVTSSQPTVRSSSIFACRRWKSPKRFAQP